MNSTDLSGFGHHDLISLEPWSTEDLQRVFATTAAMKECPAEFSRALAGKRLAMVFEKESLRTRFTFDLGIQDLGGSAVFLDHRDARLGSRESVPDVARNLARWVDCIVARTYRQRAVVELAKHSGVPVINGLTDLLHPCQALSDLFTLFEHWGSLQGRHLTYVGDGNNTCHSLLHAAPKLGVSMTICTPEGFEPNFKVMEAAQLAAQASGATIKHTHDPDTATIGAHAVYTDVWASMGQEDETEERAAIFAPYQVNRSMMERTEDGLFLHCLPAHRGHEVTPDVIDGTSSIVFDVAENRLHVQKAVMALLIHAVDANTIVPASTTTHSAPVEISA
jgi:ornithine carbamoyltransferase